MKLPTMQEVAAKTLRGLADAFREVPAGTLLSPEAVATIIENTATEIEKGGSEWASK